MKCHDHQVIIKQVLLTEKEILVVNAKFVHVYDKFLFTTLKISGILLARGPVCLKGKLNTYIHKSSSSLFFLDT